MAFSETVKERVRQMADGRCCLCEEVFVDVHHIVPQSEGGADSEDNATPLCPGCHAKFGNNPDHRKQIREMRDRWYRKCASEQLSVKDLASVINDAKELVQGLERHSPQRLLIEIDMLRKSLVSMEEFAKLAAAEAKGYRDVKERDEYRNDWPYFFGRPDEEGTRVLAEATGSDFLARGLMNGEERFVYYLLLKAGGRMDSHKFCGWTREQAEAKFPEPEHVVKCGWVNHALANLVLKGFVTGLPALNFCPGDFVEVVCPFPYRLREVVPGVMEPSRRSQ